MRQFIATAMLGIGLGFGLAPGLQAQTLKIGITLSTTGPAAALGIPERNAVAVMPTSLGGLKIDYIVLDDGGDPTRSVANARKLITEDKVDVLVGSSVTPASLPLVDVAGESKTPLVATVPTARMTAPMDDKRKWVFKVVQPDALMAEAVTRHMVHGKVKTLGFIGFNDAYGENWHSELEKIAPTGGIKIVAKESFARADTAVMGQVLKLLAANPDAVLIAASGTGAALPQKSLRERGYKGQIYQTHAIATRDFIKIGGADVEGTIFPTGPLLVAGQLPDSNPIKAKAVDFIKRYEDSAKIPFATFAGYLHDAVMVILDATPRAAKKAAPGSPAFRAALRDEIENVTELVGVHGVITMSPEDHAGSLDERARVLVRIEKGDWRLVK